MTTLVNGRPLVPYFHEHYASKEKRDARAAELRKLYGARNVHRRRSVNVQLHPEYVKDYEGAKETGPFNVQYCTMWPVLYTVEVEER